MNDIKDETVKIRVTSDMKEKLLKESAKKHPYGSLSTYLREVFVKLIKKA